jgi:NCS2 family nucleobase:cation symporter-2/xanthine permease XanP
VIAGATFVVILVFSLLATGRLRLWGPLIGVVVGSAVAAGFGVVDLTPTREAAWIGLPATGWPGLDLSFDAKFWALLPAFLIVTVVGAIETFGDGIAIQRVSTRTREPVDFKAVQGAVNADGVGNLLSGLAGTLPNTTYATSISVAQLTGVAARRVGVYGGLITLSIAFLPKLSMLIQAIPDAVVGAYVLVLLVLLFAQGLRLATGEGLTYENGFVVCLSFWLGLAFQNQLVFPDHMPAWAHTLLDNGMTSGSLTAVLLTLMLAAKNRTRDEIELEASPAAIPELQVFLARLAGKHGWDKAASDRLQLTGEEALLFLIGKEEEVQRDTPVPIPVSARFVAGALELEFRSGPGDENVESLVRDLAASEAVSADDAGLRILGHLAKEIRHEQFHDRNYLLVVVDSKPL